MLVLVARGGGATEKITDISSSDDGYEVRVPKGKRYESDNTVESHKPILKHEGHDGRSFILKAEPSENLEEDKINDHFTDYPMDSLFKNLYDEDEDGEIDDKYKRADAINENAGNPIAGTTFVEPKVSDVDTKYPHRVDSGVTNITETYDSNNDGKPDRADGMIDEQDTIVEANKPIEVNPEEDKNVVKEDGTVVLSKYYRIHVNEGDTADKDDDVYVVGTKPKVEEKELPFTTRYIEDKTKDKDYRVTTQQGVKGKETKTTTYTLDTTNGTVTENAPTTDTEQPTEEIITVGTKPKVGETPETPQPKPGETPETPQPKPGETPETPQPEQPTAPEEAPTQPGQPSEPEDQPNLKVAPPTIAIVEEPNKASIEVTAPKKDADTVKITYPKSDGSGNEVLTLTKQSSGEWTLDKQPEHVTLDKKTGTVTIPRESVVNKEKVQARAKHKTSAYTPFVYAALSIEAANPEHPVTLWVDTAGTELKKPVVGKKELAGEIAGYKWLSSRLEEGILTHTFEKVANGTPILPESSTSHPMTPSSSPSTSTPEKPNKAETPTVRTVWRDENGKDLKVPSVDKQEAGEVPGYEFVESHREGDNLTVHVFRTKQAQTPAPKDQTPSPEQAASPVPSKVSEQKGEAVATATSEKTVDRATSTKTSDKAELPNTGTEANANLAALGLLGALSGFGLLARKKKED
ncbi:cell wall surface anchor family protein [Streptococcus pneumoniae]|nr:cell wall surface anchor family protein [Streptococcus pneumoniae]